MSIQGINWDKTREKSLLTEKKARVWQRKKQTTKTSKKKR